jgi:hypothetical protein
VSYRDSSNGQSTLEITSERRSIPSVARKVVETPFGGLLIDDDEVRLLLFEEIQRRLRERGAVTWNLS